MLKVLFSDMKSIFTSLYRTAFITISIFLTTMIYGENVNLQLSYEIPDAVYEYQAGDTVEFTVKCENIGKAFETNFNADDYGHWVRASIYQKDENGNFYRLYYSHTFYEENDITLPGYDVELLNHGYIYEKTYSFVIPDDAPKGEYEISLSCHVEDDDRPENNGEYKEVYESFITVK